MRRRSIQWFLLGVFLAGALMWAPEGAAAGRQGQDGTVQLLPQSGQVEKGYFKGLNTKGIKWTVTIRPLNQKSKKTYPLAADTTLAYRGKEIPWQQGVIIDSVVELLLEQGEVKVINVLEWSS
jgi:hypothetical protein